MQGGVLISGMVLIRALSESASLHYCARGSFKGVPHRLCMGATEIQWHKVTPAS